MLLKTTGAGYQSPDLTLIFGPGIVRYLNPSDLIRDSGKLAIEEIRSYGACPTFKFSTESLYSHDFNMPDGYKCSMFISKFKFHEFPSLIEDRPYEDIIHDLAKIVSLYYQNPFPSDAYWAFHQFTESEHLIIAEFVESWVREASENHDLVESYADSNEHQLLTVEYGSTHVFKKTDYVIQRREQIEAIAVQAVKEEEERQSEETEQRFEDAIRRSSFEVFTYLMEDTRNGLIKIGKSKNPERRERTLQSEAPTVELRIAAPTNSDFEYDLHQEFSDSRQRGEWFSLSSADIKLAIERILTNGDPARVITCNDWIGRIFLAAYVQGETGSQSHPNNT